MEHFPAKAASAQILLG